MIAGTKLLSINTKEVGCLLSQENLFILKNVRGIDIKLKPSSCSWYILMRIKTGTECQKGQERYMSVY